MANTYRETIESVIKMNENLIEGSTKDIKMFSKEIAEQRKKDREMIEWVWSSGVVTEWEMNYYNKNYKSDATRKLMNRRAWEYRFRKSLEKSNREWKEMLAE